MKLCIISDTHGCHNQYKLESGDILIHCGDAEIYNKNTLSQFAKWMAKQNYKHKIFIPGNHDTFIESCTNTAYKEFDSLGINMLINDGIELEGLKFWGCPYTPPYGSWSFMVNTDKMAEIYKNAPKEVDILITHGPPIDILDYVNMSQGNVGCNELFKYVVKTRPILNCFGHIHESYGQRSFNDMVFINASLGFSLSPQRKKYPIMVEISNKKIYNMYELKEER